MGEGLGRQIKETLHQLSPDNVVAAYQYFDDFHGVFIITGRLVWFNMARLQSIGGIHNALSFERAMKVDESLVALLEQV